MLPTKIENQFIDIVVDPYLKSLKMIDDTHYEDHKGRLFERQMNPDTDNYWLVLIKDVIKEKETNDQIRNSSRDDSRACKTNKRIGS